MASAPSTRGATAQTGSRDDDGILQRNLDPHKRANPSGYHHNKIDWSAGARPERLMHTTRAELLRHLEEWAHPEGVKDQALPTPEHDRWHFLRHGPIGLYRPL
ncbi:MAG: hypothetical protein QOJ99_1283 [Bryobacterales bacterium]|nr:hypothetical protein [Bryobacterales bacterium]